MYVNPENWTSVPRILVTELKQKMDAKQKLVLVDVRSPEEFAVEHIPGAVSVALFEITEGKWTPTGSIKDPVIMY